MKNAFVSFLGDDSFVPGVLTLFQSLKETGNLNVPFILLAEESVSRETIELLGQLPIHIQTVTKINAPRILKNDFRNFECMFTKLWVFSLDEFQKIVYLDADMIVCENIEVLFEKPHMSAVTAGSILPGHNSWVELNAGLMVIEPNVTLFENLCKSLYFLPTHDGSDQGFLHSYYPLWKFDKSLHLPHHFNIPAAYLDYYCQHFDFQFEFLYNKLSVDNVSVIHFWGSQKPWKASRTHSEKYTLYFQSISLWWHWYKKIKSQLSDRIKYVRPASAHNHL